MSIFKKKETVTITPLELLQARSANNCRVKRQILLPCNVVNTA